MKRTHIASPPSRLAPWVVLFIKRSILVISWSYIIYRLWFDRSELVGKLFTTSHDRLHFFYFTTTILLCIINWGAESYKWKTALSKTCKLSFVKAFKGILYGLSVAVFTPNRSGEFVGRIWVLSPRYRLQSIVATIFSNILQLSVTIIFGILSLYFWYKKTALPLMFTTDKTKIATLIYPTIGIAILFIAFVLLTRPAWLKQRVLRPIREVISTWDSRLAIKVWLLSLFRYLIFIIQFWLLLKTFNAPISMLEVYIGIGSMYLVMALLPILTFAEPAVRSSLSVLFLSVYQPNEIGIISASLSMWVINLVIPSLLGTVILNLPKNKNHD